MKYNTLPPINPFQFDFQSNEEDDYSLHQSFAVHAHTASVRTVDTRGKYLASGGADDRIYVYDMKTRQEIQVNHLNLKSHFDTNSQFLPILQLLTPHDGIVNHLRFTPDATHVFSAASDGTLAATRTGSWISEGFWKAPHGGKSITHLSIHPSGKLALTLGADLTLRTWNLVKGRQIFTTNLKSKSSLGRIVEYVEFSPDGQNFLLSGAKSVEIWNIERAGVTREIQCDAKPTSVCWLDDANLLVGLNNGKLLWCNLEKDEQLTFEMYESRVKGLHYRDGFLASISSNGDVTIWKLTIDEPDVTELCSINIGCRPTCVTVINLSDFASEYILKKENDVSDEEAANELKKNNKAKANSQVGKVIIECDNDEDDVDAATTSKPSKVNKSRTLTETKAIDSKKKRKSVDTAITEKAIPSRVTPSRAKKSKLNQSKNSSGFIEEDIE